VDHRGRRGTIAAALFVLGLWIVTLGFQQSSFAVSLALVLLMLPVVARRRDRAGAGARIVAHRRR
jgi:ABC-type phosphate transport system permease subunit